MATRPGSRYIDQITHVMLICIAIGFHIPCGRCGDPNSPDLSISVVPNRMYFSGSTPFQLDVFITNTSSAHHHADLYVALEIQGEYYLYPSFRNGLDYKKISIPPGTTIHQEIIPGIDLPSELPLLRIPVYAVCTKRDTFTPVSNLDTISLFFQTLWPELPFPDIRNTFYFMPGGRTIDCRQNQARFDEFSEAIYSHFPPQGLYMRLGVSVTDPVKYPEHVSCATFAAEKADQANLALGLHIGVTSHHLSGFMEELRLTDRRFNQWESDGTIYNNSPSDLTCITLSRMATGLMDARKLLSGIYSEGFHNASLEYPGCLIYASGPIEVEQRRALNETPHYADYSPFAIAEFRDWICHKGIYDDVHGEFAGQGVFLSLIDNNDFSADLSPDVHQGDGPSFNEYFGTHFRSWTLKYWDLERFPDPMPLIASPLPLPDEPGYFSDGFDAPRLTDGNLIGGNARFHEIWDGYLNEYGYGFRQAMVMNYVSDSARWLTENGLPVERNFTHQIPADFIGNWIRLKGSASPFWTAINPYSNMGFTTYWETALNEPLFKIVSDLSGRWGIFEYHPDPFMTHDKLFFAQALDLVYRYRVQIICPLHLFSTAEGTYPLIGTPFEEALNDFFTASWPGTDHRRFDQPYFNQAWVDYLPPPVQDLQMTSTTLTWSETIWPQRRDLTWVNWGEFDHFEIFQGMIADFVPNPGNRIGKTTQYSFPIMQPGHYKVLAVSKSGLTSPID